MHVHPTDLAFHPHGDERLSLKPRSRDAAGDFASPDPRLEAPGFSRGEEKRAARSAGPGWKALGAGLYRV